VHGVWHLYNRGERWRRPSADMRIVIGTPECEAVAFSVPVVEVRRGSELERDPSISGLGPDILSDDFDLDRATGRIQSMPDVPIGEALLDQHAIGGIGNIFKCEALFASGIDPFARVADLSSERIGRVVEKARRLMRASIAGRRLDFSVYGRGGKQCRRCGSPIGRRKEGNQARVTYWCPRCQRSAMAANARTS
jgi:endonuclease VIII